MLQSCVEQLSGAVSMEKTLSTPGDLAAKWPQSDSATAVKMVEVVADVEGSSSSSSSSGAVTVAASVSAAEKHEQR